MEIGIRPHLLEDKVWKQPIQEFDAIKSRSYKMMKNEFWYREAAL